MKPPKPRRITRNLSPKQKARLKKLRSQISHELPEMIERDQMRKEARDEPTLSGEIRRAIAASRLRLSTIAADARIPPVALDEFLTGERTLRSDVLDRLATSLGFALSRRD
jgi:hypothetical protein